VGRELHARRVLRIVRPVAARVSDGAVEQHSAVTPDAERERRMEPAGVEPLRRGPDAIPRIRLDAELAGCDLRLPAHAGDGVEMGGNGGGGIEEHASPTLYEARAREARSARSATGNGGEPAADLARGQAAIRRRPGEAFRVRRGAGASGCAGRASWSSPRRPC